MKWLYDNSERIMIAVTAAVILFILMSIVVMINYNAICVGMGYDGASGWPSPNRISCYITEATKLIELVR